MFGAIGKSVNLSEPSPDMRVFAGAEKHDVTVIFNAEKKLESDKINVR